MCNKEDYEGYSIVFTKYAKNRLEQRGVSVEEAERAIRNPTILERYGRTKKDRIHGRRVIKRVSRNLILIGFNMVHKKELLRVITAAVKN